MPSAIPFNKQNSLSPPVSPRRCRRTGAAASCARTPHACPPLPPTPCVAVGTEPLRLSCACPAVTSLACTTLLHPMHTLLPCVHHSLARACAAWFPAPVARFRVQPPTGCRRCAFCAGPSTPRPPCPLERSLCKALVLLSRHVCGERVRERGLLYYQISTYSDTDTDMHRPIRRQASK